MHIDELADWIRDPGSSNLSAMRTAAALGLKLEDLAAIARVDPDELRRDPDSPRAQAVMLDILRLAYALAELDTDISQTMPMLKSTPVREFDNLSLLDLVRSGRADDAIAYLRSISSGFVG